MPFNIPGLAEYQALVQQILLLVGDTEFKLIQHKASWGNPAYIVAEPGKKVMYGYPAGWSDQRNEYFYRFDREWDPTHNYSTIAASFDETVNYLNESTFLSNPYSWKTVKAGDEITYKKANGSFITESFLPSLEVAEYIHALYINQNTEDYQGTINNPDPESYYDASGRYIYHENNSASDYTHIVHKEIKTNKKSIFYIIFIVAIVAIGYMLFTKKI